jgi:flavin-dependent dehydrogenase
MYDAIVVGARAAGSPTAMLLARQGHSVLVVDRATFPSDTFSTHFITAPGSALLERWGARQPLEARGVPFFDHVVLNVNGNVMSSKDLFGARTLTSPRRTDLDFVLRDLAIAAGADVCMETTVTAVLQEDGRVVGVALRDKDGETREERAPVVIGADGRTSVVARAVTPAERDRHEIHGRGLYAYFDEFDYVSEAAGFFDSAFLFAFPTGARSACIGTEIGPERDADVRANPEKVFFEKIALDDDLFRRVVAARRDGRWHTGELDGGFFRRASGPGWALVGDAALTKDPLLGHGITDSFIGAELLAQAVHEGLGGDMDAALARYDDALWDHLRPIYEASRDAAATFDLPGDELFGAIAPAQMLIAEEFERVAAGGPTL